MPLVRKHLLQERCSLTVILINNQKLFSDLEKKKLIVGNSSLIRRRVKHSSLNLSHSAMLNHLDLRTGFKLFSKLEKSLTLP